MKELISKKRLKIWKTDKDIKIAFTVTDRFISLGLFSIEGTYDPTKDLISYNEKAIVWGNKLFEYYRNQAEKVKL